MNIKWLPIETAPKDKRILLFYKESLFTGVQVVFGKWNDERYCNNPKPHWVSDLRSLQGKANCRSNQPTHWASGIADITEID